MIEQSVTTATPMPILQRVTSEFDTPQATEYLSKLFDPSDRIALMFLKKDADVRHKFLTAEEAASSSCLKQLQKANAAGWNVYVCMNPLKADRRVKENIAAIRTIYLDVDENGRAAFDKIFQSQLVPEPSFVLQSSPDKFYFVWRIEPSLSASEQESLLKAMVQEFGADPAATDAVRVLRLPGLKNHKYADTPEVEIIHYGPDKLYSRDQFRVSLKPPTEKKTEHSTDPRFLSLRKAVGFRPLVRRVNALPDPRSHVASPDLEPGDLHSCPFHKHSDFTPNFGAIRENRLMAHCLGKCGGSWDVVSAVAQFDNLKTQFDAAKVICKEEGLDYETFFPKESKPKTEAKKELAAKSEKSKRVEPKKQAATQEQKSVYTLEVIRASDVVPDVQNWFWENRIPQDTLSMLAGEPDQGKSIVSTDLIARATTGREMPDGTPNPFDGRSIECLMLIAEDALSTTVKPRLISAGADCTKIQFVKSISCPHEKNAAKRQLYLDTDLHAIQETLQKQPEIKLVTIDPVSNYLGERDMNSEQDVRRVLGPVLKMAEDLKVTFICIAHFNKNDRTSAINRTGGAKALTGLPRAVWCCMTDPKNKDRYLMLSIKKNQGRKAKGLSYTIEEAFIPIPNLPKPVSVPKLVWGELVDTSADEALQAIQDPQVQGQAKAERFLQDFLANGPVKSVDMHRASEAEGIPARTLDRARRNLRTESEKIVYVWYTRLDRKHPWPTIEEVREKDKSVGVLDGELAFLNSESDPF